MLNSSRKKSNILLVILLFTIFGLGLFYCVQKLLLPKYYFEMELSSGFINSNGGIYDLPEDSLDVVFIGSSHVFYSINPDQLFDESGITSYDYASERQNLWQSYYYVEDLFRDQHPKIVILEALGILQDTYIDSSYNHMAIDRLRFSSSKINAAKRVHELNPDEKIIDYILPALNYHDRIYELEALDYDSSPVAPLTVSKGFRICVTTNPKTDFDYAAQYENYDYETLYELYGDIFKNPTVAGEPAEEMSKIKALCEENGATLVLAKMPCADVWSDLYYQSVKKWAAENGVTYIDCNGDIDVRNAIAIDYSTDSLDGGNHLNYYGAAKNTSWWAKYLSENYEFKDKRNDADYAFWHDDYQQVLNYKEKCELEK